MKKSTRKVLACCICLSVTLCSFYNGGSAFAQIRPRTLQETPSDAGEKPLAGERRNLLSERDIYTPGTDFTYSTLRDGYSITEYSGTDTDIIISPEWSGKPIRHIKGLDGPFRMNTNITSVIMPDTIEALDDRVFEGCSSLASVVLPSGLTRLEEYLFMSCQLTEIDIPDGVTFIGNAAFAINKLSEVVIPDGVTEIEVNVFAMNQLTDVHLPASLHNLGWGAFSYNLLEQADLPIGLESIGNEAFRSNKLLAAVIPDSVTTLGDSVFEDNQLLSIEIPDSVTSLGDSILKDQTATMTYSKVGDKFGIDFAARYPDIDPVKVLNLKLVSNGGDDVPVVFDSAEGVMLFDRDPGEGSVLTYDYEVGNARVTSGGKNNVSAVLQSEIICTVIFDSQEGTGVEEQGGIPQGSLLSRPADPVREGYRFNGWYMANTSGTLWDFEHDQVQNDMILYAGWNERVYTVHYDTQGGSAIADRTGVKYSDSQLIPEVFPVKVGWRFMGWLLNSALRADSGYITEHQTYGQLAGSDRIEEITLIADWREENKPDPDKPESEESIIGGSTSVGGTGGKNSGPKATAIPVPQNMDLPQIPPNTVEEREVKPAAAEHGEEILPKTGGETSGSVWIILMGISVLGLFGMSVRKKRK